MSRLLVRADRRRGDRRPPYLLAEEIVVEHPMIFRRAGRQSTIGGIPITRMESTGRRDPKVFDVIVTTGTTARGDGSVRSRDRARARATAAGIKKVCRQLRPREAERIDSIDAEIAVLEGRIAEARDRRETVVREAWRKANVVRLAEFEERAARFESDSSATAGEAD